MLKIAVTHKIPALENANQIHLVSPTRLLEISSLLGLVEGAVVEKPKPFSTTLIQRDGSLHLLIHTPSNLDNFGFKEVGGLIARANIFGKFFINCAEFSPEQFRALAVGLLAGGYQFSTFKSKSKPQSTLDLELLVEGSNFEWAGRALQRTEVVAESLTLARDLANTPANHLSPDQLARQALTLLDKEPVRVEVWDEKRLAQEGCGAILAVGQGSANPPRLVRIHYGKGPVQLSIVGKGITFDTGGLSLKPADSMLGMKYDMTGAAVALGAILAIAKLGLPVTVEAILCLAENMPGPNATRPGDIVRSRSGKTIEITNTDAEGRLVLADGIHVALEENPVHLIDVATLTGAATIALGTRFAGLMGSGEAPELFLEAASAANERFWRMPLPDDARRLLDSTTADLMNAKVGSRAGGMLVGAQFLADFVNADQVRSWAHLDIANTASNDSAPYEEHPSGPTGYGLRSIVQLAENLSRSE